MVLNRMFSKKSHDLSFELMSSRYVEFNYHESKKAKDSSSKIIV